VQRSSQKEFGMARLEDETRDALRRLSVPAERPRFFEELRSRMQEHDRVSARRWRLTSMAAAAVTVSAVAAASVLAAQTLHSSATEKTAVVDRTISCQVAPTHAVYVAASVEIHVIASLTNPARVIPAVVGVTTWPRYATPSDRSVILGQLNFSAAVKGLTVDPLRCRTSRKSVALRPAGLPSNGTHTASFLGGTYRVCRGASRVLVRYRVTEVGGLPQKAQVAVRNEDRRAKPLAYIDWTTKRVTTYTLAGCSPFQYITVP
jgi:hypothetical protein